MFQYLDGFQKNRAIESYYILSADVYTQIKMRGQNVVYIGANVSMYMDESKKCFVVIGHRAYILKNGTSGFVYENIPGYNILISRQLVSKNVNVR